MHGFLKEHEISFVAVPMPKLFCTDAGSLASVVDETCTSLTFIANRLSVIHDGSSLEQ